MGRVDLYGRHSPAQDRWEITKLVAEVQMTDTITVLEIGTHRGGSARMWRDALWATRVITVCSADEFEGDSTRIERVLGKSQELTTFDKVCDVLGNATVDFLFIDGDHRYEQVKEDWKLYRSLSHEFALVAFHDVIAEPGVAQLWSEIRQTHKTILFYNPPDGTGTGVVYL